MDKIKCLIYLGNYYNKNLSVIDFEISSNSNPTIEDYCKHVNFDIKEVNITESNFQNLNNSIFLIQNS